MDFNYKIVCYANNRLVLAKFTNNSKIAYAIYELFIENTQYVPYEHTTVQLIYKGKILKNFIKGLDK